MTDPEWRDEFVRDGELRSRGERATLTRAVREGALTRVSRGIYAPPIESGLRRYQVAEREHHRLIRAAQLTSPSSVISHRSAALLWKLPLFERLPDTVHVTTGKSAGGRSTTLLTRHGVDPGAVVQLSDALSTSLARTVVDVARISSFREAVAVADAALRGLADASGRVIRAPLPKEQLFDELVIAGSGRGVAQARAVIEFADANSGSAGESCSRVGFMVLGLPKPILQQRFDDVWGLIGFTDFWWPRFRLIGEFDGALKYTDPDFLRGRTPEAALADEKRREDRLRAPGRGMSRWGWSTAISLPKLRTHLREAGLG